MIYSKKTNSYFLKFFIFFVLLLIIKPTQLHATINSNFAETWLNKFPFIKEIRNGKIWKYSEDKFIKQKTSKTWNFEKNKQQTILTASHNKIKIWGLIPYRYQLFFTKQQLSMISIYLWNKGDSKNSDNKFIIKKIKSFLNSAKQNRLKVIRRKKKISAKYTIKFFEIIIDQSVWQITIEKKDFIKLEIKPCIKNNNLNIVQQHIKNSRQRNQHEEKKIFRSNLTKNVSQLKNGDTIIQGIPMIDQGDKGYCAPATCARILKYYGINTDEHEIAKIMDTKKGTSMINMKKSLKKLSSGSPFYAKEIKFTFSTIQRYLDRGTPLIWAIPKHVRMIIGYNKDNKIIIYSDSWGQKGKQGNIPFKQAKKINQYLGVLK